MKYVVCVCVCVCVFVRLFSTHPVSFNKSHKHREEDRGWRRFGVLPEELHRLVEGVLFQRQGTYVRQYLDDFVYNFVGFSRWHYIMVCSCYLCNLGIILQLLQLALIVCNEVFQHGVVSVHAVLSFGQLHASVQLLDVQQDILQRHCEYEQQQCEQHVQIRVTILN